MKLATYNIQFALGKEERLVAEWEPNPAECGDLNIAYQVMGEGFLAVFDGPTRAIQCAATIRDRMEEFGLNIRAGVHTGKREWRGEDLSGIAVHLASRLLDHAQPGEVLATRTVKDLVVGSGIAL